MNYYNLFKNIAFRLDPELAHNQSLSLLSKFPKQSSKLFKSMRRISDFDLEKYDLSLTLNDGNFWTFPVGLAAGLDKNAEAIDFFTRIPFGAVEVGTVTPKAQIGNPKPRMFRLKEEESLLNRMGFNNQGMNEIYENVVKAKRNGKVVGVNLGKNKITPADKACEDYQLLFKKFKETANYIVINVSSPNTPGLRDLQNIEALREIFSALSPLRNEEAPPLYLKIAPDLSFEDIPGIVQLAHDFNLAGILATNTTIMPEKGQGGISGKLLKERATKMRKHVLEVIGSGSSLEMIGIGGISNSEDLFSFWKMGGKVAQIYTSFIYQGPQILFDMEAEIVDLLKRNDMTRLMDLFENREKVRF